MKLCSPGDSLSKASHLADTDLQATSFSFSWYKTCLTRETEGKVCYKRDWSQVFPHLELLVKALPNCLSSDLIVVCCPAGSGHHPCAEHPGVDSSQCVSVCNPECAGECACCVQGLGREFTGGLFRDANWEGKGGFSSERYF